MTDLERGLEVDQKKGATAAAATAEEAIAQNGSAEAEAGVAAEPATAAADSTVRGTLAIGRSVKLNTFQERTITRNTVVQTMNNGPARECIRPTLIDCMNDDERCQMSNVANLLSGHVGRRRCSDHNTDAAESPDAVARSFRQNKINIFSVGLRWDERGGLL